MPEDARRTTERATIGVVLIGFLAISALVHPRWLCYLLAASLSFGYVLVRRWCRRDAPASWSRDSELILFGVIVWALLDLLLELARGPYR